MSTVTRIGGGVHPVMALGVLLVAAAMVTAWGWTRVVRALGLPWGVAGLGVALAFVDPFLLSAVGLEVVLIPALLVLLLVTALEGRVSGFGVVAGVMLLTRLDLVVFVVLAALGTARIRHGWRRALLVAVAIAGPWFVASWLLLGSAIPDTLLLKVDQTGGFATHDYLTGPADFFDGRPREVALAFAPAMLGLAGLAAALAAWRAGRWNRPDAERLAPVAAIGLGGIAYYGVYCVLSVPPYHWYYVAPIAALTIVAVTLGGAWMRAAGAGRRRPVAAVVPLGALAALAIATATSDLAHGVPWRSPVIFGNFASARDYARVGVALRKRIGRAGVASPGEIGTLAYFCDCAIFDEFSDRGRVVEHVEYDLEHGFALKRLALAVNYLWLDRGQAPREPRYQLAYLRGPGAEGRNAWNVTSVAYGAGRFELLPRPPGQ